MSSLVPTPSPAGRVRQILSCLSPENSHSGCSSSYASLSSISSSSSSASSFFHAEVSLTKCLTAPQSPRHCKYLEFSVPSPTFSSYSPGDYVLIQPENSQEVMDLFIERLNLHGLLNRLYDYYAEAPATLLTLLTSQLDLNSPPSSSLLLFLSQWATHEKERFRLEFLSSETKHGKLMKELYINNNELNVVDVLMHHPSITYVDIQELIYQLPKISPRFYSIATSPTSDPNTIGLCTGLVVSSSSSPYSKHQQLQNVPFHGLSSHYLHHARRGHKVNLKIVKSSFHLPQETQNAKEEESIIMIATGVGIAPFRGFIHHRIHKYKEMLAKQYDNYVPGQMYLIYGCDFSNADFLFSTEFISLAEEFSSFFHFYPLFSMEPSPQFGDLIPKFMQVEVLINPRLKQLVMNVLSDQIYKGRSRIYICGSRVRLGDGIRQSLIELIKEIKQNRRPREGDTGIAVEDTKATVDNEEALYKSLEEKKLILKDVF